MLYKAGDVFDSEAGVKFSELLIYELSVIVDYDGVRHAIATYNIFPDELLDLLRCDSGQWFSFYPFGKVVDSYYEEFYLSFSRGEGPRMSIPYFTKGHGESMECSYSCF